jgi:hypothetical protein
MLRRAVKSLSFQVFLAIGLLASFTLQAACEVRCMSPAAPALPAATHCHEAGTESSQNGSQPSPHRSQSCPRATHSAEAITVQSLTVEMDSSPDVTATAKGLPSGMAVQALPQIGIGRRLPGHVPRLVDPSASTRALRI